MSTEFIDAGNNIVINAAEVSYTYPNMTARDNSGVVYMKDGQRISVSEGNFQYVQWSLLPYTDGTIRPSRDQFIRDYWREKNRG